MEPPAALPAPYWTMRLADGWRAEQRGDHVAVLNAHPGTLLRLTTFDPAASGMTARQWVEMAARVHPPQGRPLAEVRCGDFSGFRTEFGWLGGSAPSGDEDGWLRGWMLECDGLPLDVTYTCPLSAAGRDDADLRAMLETLRLVRVARG
jgi:hypothetical protein